MKDKFVKIIFGKSSGYYNDFQYKIKEVNIAKEWNPTRPLANKGGFNIWPKDKAVRWLNRGDTIYDVIIPDDAEVVDCSDKENEGLWRTNMLILNNPQRITDEIAMKLYQKTKLSDDGYFKALGGMAMQGYKDTCYQLIRDHINPSNVLDALKEISNFKELTYATYHGNAFVYEEIVQVLKEIDSKLLIAINWDKDIYKKKLTNDKIINITGESGSGKSYYTSKYIEDSNYIVIDTDLIFGNNVYDDKIIDALKRRMFLRFGFNYKNKLIDNFDACYKVIVNYFKKSDKTTVIDSGQYRNMKKLNNLKGEVIVLRTSIDKCYERCIKRYKHNKDASKMDLEMYVNKKKKMYVYYHKLNEFLTKIDQI